MKKFRYNGEKGRMRGVFGLDFSDHRTVEVEDQFIIGKLSGNSHFDEVIDEPAPVEETPPAAPPVTEEKKVVVLPVVVTEPAPKSEKGINPKSEKTCAGKVGLFRIQKADGKPYSKPDKTFLTKEEAETYMTEKGINPEERLILEKA